MTTTEDRVQIGVLCHCTDDIEGHAPGADEFRCAPFSKGPGTGTPGGPASMTARGTCPKCTRTGVRVTAPVRTWHHPDVHDGVRLGLELELASHKRPERGGEACDYVGGPAETRFTPSIDLRNALDKGREHIR